MQDTDIVAMED